MTYKSGKQIVMYILNHKHCLTLFRSKSKLDLLKLDKTRFASHYIFTKEAQGLPGGTCFDSGDYIVEKIGMYTDAYTKQFVGGSMLLP